MANIFGAFSSFAGGGVILKYIGWFFAFAILAASLTTIIIMVLVGKQRKKILEIDMVNKRLKIYNGRYKKTGQGVKQFWIGKLKKFLPAFQQKDIYIKGNRDWIILFKDNNGLHHTARTPSAKEMKRWFKEVHSIDLDIEEKEQSSLTKQIEKRRFLPDIKGIAQNTLRSLYLLPSPHEDLDWLSSKVAEADKEFKIEHWWQSPTIAYIGVGFICFLMIVVSLIIEKKM